MEIIDVQVGLDKLLRTSNYGSDVHLKLCGLLLAPEEQPMNALPRTTAHIVMYRLRRIKHFIIYTQENLGHKSYANAQLRN
jgi:hypothetical protein